MTDRLEEIKARVAYHVPGGDMPWLIAEVERLRAENAPLKQSNARFFDDVVALRGALQALVDALNGLETYTGDGVPAVESVKRLAAARAVAVGLLSQQEAQP